jgi:hypothetical protein
VAAFFAAEFEQRHGKTSSYSRITTGSITPRSGWIPPVSSLFLQFVPVTDRATGRASAGLQAQLGKNELNDDEVQHHEYDELFHVGPSGPFSR